jgi:hypothetical protein
MVLKGLEYRPNGGSRRAVKDRETANPSREIAEAILHFLFPKDTVFSDIKHCHDGILYHPGDAVPRQELHVALKQFRSCESLFLH